MTCLITNCIMTTPYSSDVKKVETMHAASSAGERGAIRAPRLALAVAFAALVVTIVSVGPAQASHGGSIGCGDGCVKVPLLFDPTVSPAAKPSGAQPGQEWDGTAPAPDPLGLTQAADVREFAVLSGNASLAVEITWDPGPALS